MQPLHNVGTLILREVSNNLKDRMEYAPKYKRPRRAMPQAANKKNDEDIQETTSFSLAIAAQRKVKLFGKPTRQRDMPSMPEIRN